MLDEMERLRESESLHDLLGHYVALGKEDRQIWHDRLLEFAGLQGRELARLYGELIAHAWLEQNTGITPVLERGRFGACYRVTSAGQRAHKQIRKELAAAHS
jgi:hypothetical protein